MYSMSMQTAELVLEVHQKPGSALLQFEETDEGRRT